MIWFWYLLGCAGAAFGGYKVGYWVCWDSQVTPLLQAINAWKVERKGMMDKPPPTDPAA